MVNICIILLLLTAVLLCSCGQEQPKSPDIDYFDTGYGTYFVTGTRIEHRADTSSSTVVDWRGGPAAKAGEGVKFEEVKGIVYSHSTFKDGRQEGEPLDLHLNLTMRAEDGSQEKGRPVILLIPGGGFITCRIDNKYTEIQRWLAERGYAIAIMQYHTVGQGRYCDAGQDVRDAIRWVREHADQYGLDPERIALMGNSAGGYVAALAACQDSSDIRCVVNFYGLSDIADNKADYEAAAIEAQHAPQSSDSQFVNGVLSGKGLPDDPAEAAKADPVTYVDGDEPPFLHLHGDADLLVSPSQTLHLHEALLAAGEESTRYSVIGAGHGDPAFRTEAAMKVVLDFLKQNL